MVQPFNALKLSLEIADSPPTSDFGDVNAIYDNIGNFQIVQAAMEEKKDEPTESGILGDLVTEIKKSRNPAIAPDTKLESSDENKS